MPSQRARRRREPVRRQAPLGAPAGESLQEALRAAQGGGVERLPLLRSAWSGRGPACTEDLRQLSGIAPAAGLQGIDTGTGADVLGATRATAPACSMLQVGCPAARAARTGVRVCHRRDDAGRRLLAAAACRQAPAVQARGGVARTVLCRLARALEAAFARSPPATFGVEATPSRRSTSKASSVGNMAVAIAKYRLEVLGAAASCTRHPARGAGGHAQAALAGPCEGKARPADPAGRSRSARRSRART